MNEHKIHIIYVNNGIFHIPRNFNQRLIIWDWRWVSEKNCRVSLVPQFTGCWRKKSDERPFLQALNGRFLCFALFFPSSPQNSCRFGLIYYHSLYNARMILKTIPFLYPMGNSFLLRLRVKWFSGLSTTSSSVSPVMMQRSSQKK